MSFSVDIVKQYTWKELSTDGLLREPRNVGYEWEDGSVNGHTTYFDSEEEAIKAYKEFAERFGEEFSIPCELVLVTSYATVFKEDK